MIVRFMIFPPSNHGEASIITPCQPNIAETDLTTKPGPDVAPCHGRQVALLGPSAWAAWLDHEVAAGDLLGPAPAGSLVVRADRVGG